MEFKSLINERRSYRILKKVNIDTKITDYLANATALAPSCFNNQPWRYIFVTVEDRLTEMRPVLLKGNEWAYDGSLIIAVFSEKESDCVVANREYYLFDTGIGVGFLLLAAADLGLVAHPIAGFSESKAKKVLGIPQEKRLITLIIVGAHDKERVTSLPDKEKRDELTRPLRKPVNEFVHFNHYESKEDRKDDN